METFAPARAFVPNPDHARRRARALAELDPAAIDPPLAGLIRTLARVPHAFTLQCCWGHFVHPGQPDAHGLAPLAGHMPGATVLYRLAYVALCLENSEPGHALFADIQGLTAVDPACVQWGSPDWFWQQHPNAYALQVEPERFKDRDSVRLETDEARHIQRVRDTVFEKLAAVAAGHV